MKRRMANQIPEEIQSDPELTKAMEQVRCSLSSGSFLLANDETCAFGMHSVCWRW